MWDTLEKVVPEALPAIRRQHIVARIALLGVLLSLPAVALLWPRVRLFLMQGETLDVPVRLFLAIVALAVSSCVVVALMSIGFRRRLRLRRFIQEWVEFRERFALLYIKIDGWLVRDAKARGFDDPAWPEILDSIRDYSGRRASLRRLLFIIGEQNVVAQHSQHWLELKSQHRVFSERDYLTPFGFLLDIGAPIPSINHNGEAIWAALFISDEYLEYLRYRHRFLERVGVMPPNQGVAPDG